MAHRNRDCFVTPGALMLIKIATRLVAPRECPPGAAYSAQFVDVVNFVEAGLRRRAGDPCREPHGYGVAGSSRDSSQA